MIASKINRHDARERLAFRMTDSSDNVNPPKYRLLRMVAEDANALMKLEGGEAAYSESRLSSIHQSSSLFRILPRPFSYRKAPK
jgi:hypothetical protein